MTVLKLYFERYVFLTKLKGDITELEVLTYATKKGLQVSQPIGDRARYDQIWDLNGKLYKIQVKTSNLKKDGLLINCRSNTVKNGKISYTSYTKDEIDFFATYFNNNCYLIPVEESNSTFFIRFIPPKNNQKRGINYSKDYTLENILGIG